MYIYETKTPIPRAGAGGDDPMLIGIIIHLIVPKQDPSSASQRAPRSVRFFLVGVIVGEDCRAVGEKWIYPAARAF